MQLSRSFRSGGCIVLSIVAQLHEAANLLRCPDRSGGTDFLGDREWSTRTDGCGGLECFGFEGGRDDLNRRKWRKQRFIAGPSFTRINWWLAPSVDLAVSISAEHEAVLEGSRAASTAEPLGPGCLASFRPRRVLQSRFLHRADSDLRPASGSIQSDRHAIRRWRLADRRLPSVMPPASIRVRSPTPNAIRAFTSPRRMHRPRRFTISANCGRCLQRDYTSALRTAVADGRTTWGRYCREERLIATRSTMAG